MSSSPSSVFSRNMSGGISVVSQVMVETGDALLCSDWLEYI